MRFGWGWVRHARTGHAGTAGDRVRALIAWLPASRDGLSFRLGPPFWQRLGAIVLGAMLARWMWILFAPPVGSVGGIVDRGAPGEADTLFGIAAASGSDSRAPGVLPNVRLTGVYAGTPGFAILELDGNRQVGVTLGAEVVRGVILAQIAADYVVLEGGGARQRVDLMVGRPGVANAAAGMPGLARGPADSPLPPGVMPPAPNGPTQDPRETIRRELTARGLP